MHRFSPNHRVYTPRVPLELTQIKGESRGVANTLVRFPTVSFSLKSVLSKSSKVLNIGRCQNHGPFLGYPNMPKNGTLF